MSSPLEMLDSLPDKAPTQQVGAMDMLDSLPDRQEAPTEVGAIDTFLSGGKEGITTDTALSSAGTLIKATDTGSRLLGTAKEYGVDEEAWKSMTQSERRILISEVDKQNVRKNITPGTDTESFAYKAGRFVGSMVDPTTLIPLGGAAKLGKAAQLVGMGEKVAATTMAAKGLTSIAVSGAAIGGADAALYTAAQQGEINPTAVAGGVILGAVAPPALYGVGKAVGKGLEKVVSVGTAKKAANATLKAINEQKAAFRAEGLSEPVALARAVQTLGLDDAALAKVLRKTKAQPATYASVADAKTAMNVARMGTGKAPKLHGIKSSLGYALTPMDSKLKDVAPAIYGKVMEVEQESKLLLHNYDKAVEKHIADIKLLKKKGVLGKYWTMALSDGNEKEMQLFLRANLGDEAVANYKSYSNTMADMLAKENSVRGKKNTIKGKSGYYPRYAADYEGLRKAVGEKYGSKVATELENKLRKLGKGKKVVSEHDKGKVIADFVTDLYQRPAKITPGFSKKRTIKDIDDDLLKFYSPLEQSIHTRIRRGVDDYAMRKVLGKEINEKYGDSVENGVVDWLGTLADKNLIMKEDITYIQSLLKSRYINGLQGTGKATQLYKAVMHGTLLPQLPSIITQGEDLARTAWRYGVADTAKAVFLKVNKHISPKEQGFLDNLAEEYIHQGLAKNIVNKEFKYTGFQAADLMGKAAQQNAALLNFGKKATTVKGATEIHQKYFPILGGKRSAKVLEDFKAFHKAKLKGEKAVATDDMRLIAFMELAEIQPITQWGMPQAYVDNPRARFMYTLRSFTIKQLDNYRTDVLGNIQKGNYAKAMKTGTKLIAYMTAAGIAKDEVVDYISAGVGLPRKKEETEDRFYKNLLRATGIFDKHTMGNFGYDPIEGIVMGVAPPSGIIKDAWQLGGDVGKDMVTEESVEYDDNARQFISYIPFIGRMISSWMKAEEESKDW